MLGIFDSIFDLMEAFPDEQSCIDHLEKIRWDGKVVSPFDNESKVYKCKNNRYHCKETGKYFNVKTGTVFENTNIPMRKWFVALYLFSSHKKGISSHQLARDISVTQKTAWFMLHRLRYMFDHPSFNSTMRGEVEVDETLIGGKEGNKHMNRRTKGAMGRSTRTKKPVFGMKQRGGHVYALVVDDVKARTLVPVIADTVRRGTTVYTDTLKSYNGLGRRYDHTRVNHSAKEYVNGRASTNGIENFWSHLKRGIDGIYHSVSVSHLQAYVDEFSYRYNTRKMATEERFNTVLHNMEGRLTYQDLITYEYAR